MNDTWRCDYCGRENYGDALTCTGCQAGRPELRAKHSNTYNLEIAWRGTPLSQIPAADRDIAAGEMIALSSDGSLYVGGSFADHVATADYIARYNNGVWETL